MAAATIARFLLSVLSVLDFAKSQSMSCIKAGSEACPTASNNCGGAVTLQNSADVDAWLVADNGNPCTVIGGSFTINKNIQPADLAKMLPLVAVCGDVAIQQLSTGTLAGLDNLAHIGGSFAFQQNARPWATGGDINDISAFSSLKYVGGAVNAQQNLYLTESDFAAGLNCVRIGGSVNIEFYDNPPATVGGTATSSGRLQQCSASASGCASPAPTSVSTSVPATSTSVSASVSATSPSASSSVSASPTSLSTSLSATSTSVSAAMIASQSFSCIKAGLEACPTASNNCGGAVTLNTGADVDAWLVADNGNPCTVIGGSLTISKTIQPADLAKMLPLVAVCGAVAIQQLATGTLAGLDNLAHIGGSFAFQQNARPWATGGDVNDISAFSKLKYIGGAVNAQQNYYLTESDFAAGLNNVRIGGAVNIEFYDTPPATAGETAGATGRLQQCSGSASAISTSMTMMMNDEPEPEAWHTTSLEPEPEETSSMEVGECVGNDSRCKSADFGRCKALEAEGSDCRWVKTADGSSSAAMSSGECTGNDSRCASSKQAKCLRLGNQGSDCTWTSAFKAGESSGTCAGNDSRCPNKLETQCRSLGQEGADCKWRESFSAQGTIKLQVTNAKDFVNNAAAVDGVKEGISNVTKVPKTYIELDVYTNDQTSRRLDTRALQAVGEVIITYVINVGADAPASIAVTSDMVSKVMASANKDAINQAIVSKVEESVGTNNYAIAVTETGVSVVVYNAPGGNVTANVSSFAGGNMFEDGALPSAAHPLLALIGSSFYFF